MKVFTAVLLGLALISLTACNTVQGLGQDIESVGKAGERAI